jgi:6-phosphofructokinase 1
MLENAQVGGLIVIGGNGSQAGALALSRAGVAVNGVASTIDNDLAGTDITVGVDSALAVAVEAIDRLRTTATSHHRLFIVEVMGRDCGYLALAAGVAGGAEVIVTPEFDMMPCEVVERVHEAYRRGKRHAIVVIAEGARLRSDAYYSALVQDREESFSPRVTVLGHTQRGGCPTAYDRLLATRLASRGADLLLAGDAGKLVGMIGGTVTATLLSEVVGKPKPLSPELILIAETMRI